MNNALVSNAISNMTANETFNMEYTADCGFPKKSGLNGILKRVVTTNALFNADYESEVNARLTANGKAATFVAQSLPWGTWFDFDKVIEHKGEYYLRYYTQASTSSKVTYLESDGTPCSAARVQAIKAYLDTKTKSLVQTQANSGLVRNQVIAKNIKFSNLISLTIKGVKYTESAAQSAAV